MPFLLSKTAFFNFCTLLQQ